MNDSCELDRWTTWRSGKGERSVWAVELALALKYGWLAGRTPKEDSVGVL